MATNKKPRKKNHRNKPLCDIPTKWLNNMFSSLIIFLDDLKSGVARIAYTKENIAYVVLIYNKKEHEAYTFIHHWSLLMRLILGVKNIFLDFQPFLDFGNSLKERHLAGHLYFDALEITKVKAFILKILNIFHQEISVQHINKGRQLLEQILKANNININNNNNGVVLQNGK